jgi:hypothetical protein
MTDARCSCDYQAADEDELTIHLSEAVVPGDDVAADGSVHAERVPAVAEGRGCVCGLAASRPSELDAHLLAAFSSPDGVGRDGLAHG